LKLVAGHK